MKSKNQIFDALLVLKCQSGDRKALSLLINRWHVRLCRQASWYTKDLEEAKDIVQDSWRIIIQKIHSLKDADRFGSWATTIVTRKAIDRIKKNKKELKVLEAYYEVSKKDNQSSEDKNLSKAPLLSAIKNLNKNQQQVLHLFYVEEYSMRQISEILNVSVGTVKSRLFHAREKLKTILKNVKDE